MSVNTMIDFYMYLVLVPLGGVVLIVLLYLLFQEKENQMLYDRYMRDWDNLSPSIPKDILYKLERKNKEIRKLIKPKV